MCMVNTEHRVVDLDMQSFHNDMYDHFDACLGSVSRFCRFCRFCRVLMTVETVYAVYLDSGSGAKHGWYSETVKLGSLALCSRLPDH